MDGTQTGYIFKILEFMFWEVKCLLSTFYSGKSLPNNNQEWRRFEIEPVKLDVLGYTRT